MNIMKWIMIVVLAVLGLSEAFMGSNYWLTPLAEWLTTILYVNYFALLSFTNNYFDSVHRYDSVAFQPK